MKSEKLNDILIKAVKNSELKKYHGGIEIAFPMKESGERVDEIIKEEGLLNYETWEETKNDDDLMR
jgi:hypothetical protein